MVVFKKGEYKTALHGGAIEHSSGSIPHFDKLGFEMLLQNNLYRIVTTTY